MIIHCNKNITKLKNNQIIGIIITLQRLLQSTKHTLMFQLLVEIIIIKKKLKKLYVPEKMVHKMKQ